MNEWGSQLENRFHRDEYDSVWRWRGRRGPNWFVTIQHMTIQRMEHVGIVVDDLQPRLSSSSSSDSYCRAREPSKAVGWTASLGSRAYGRTLR